MKNKKLQTEQTLWCLPYDTDSVFKPFLKISFSSYINNIISNEYFPAYQISTSNEIKDRAAWNEKCWRLIQYFQFLNDNFDIKAWDSHINFIEDNHLRSIMGFFRLWIDAERLYLLNFLKLDSNQFQEDRIFMCLYRTLIFFNSLFNQYMFNDFEGTFLTNFIRQSVAQLRNIKNVSTNDTADIIDSILILLENIKKKEKILIEFSTLQTLKKSALIKVSKEAEAIRQVQMRLKNSSLYKKKLDEQRRLRMITKNEFIDDFVQPILTSYDPIALIQQKQREEQLYGITPEQKERKYREAIAVKVDDYKKEVKNPEPDFGEVNVYGQVKAANQNPYSLKNYQVYGQAIKISMDDKQKYEKVKEAEVVSVDDYDRSKLYYDDKFFKDMEAEVNFSSKVTVKDINISTRSKKKVVDFKNQDENTRVFNLKWHTDANFDSKRRHLDENQFAKDYDNNLLFKSPLQEQLLQTKRNNLDKLRQLHDVKSYTVALLEQTGAQIHPEYIISSQGSNLFIKKTPQILDLRNFKFLNQNKFDFMRKVVGYMTVQKKIKDVIILKAPPETYPRYYSDVHQESYNPQLIADKIEFAQGRTNRRPALHL